MMAPDLPLEPAPRKDFSSTTTRPTRRCARASAMLTPMTPPPTIRMSQVCMVEHTFTWNEKDRFLFRSLQLVYLPRQRGIGSLSRLDRRWLQEQSIPGHE